MKPLTPKMQGVLATLVALRDSDSPSDYPAPPSKIAQAMIRAGTLSAERIEASGGGRGRGSGHRVMNPAQRLITPLRHLHRRGLIYHARRPDGMTGGAYGVTPEGAKRAT